MTKPAHRPRLFNDTEEDIKRFNSLVEKYFNDVDLENYDQSQLESSSKFRKSYSMGKLALALGMTSETLYDYEKNPNFSETIKRSRERVREDLQEKALTDRSVASVSIFLLKALHGLRDGNEENKTVIINNTTKSI